MDVTTRVVDVVDDKGILDSVTISETNDWSEFCKLFVEIKNEIIKPKTATAEIMYLL